MPVKQKRVHHRGKKTEKHTKRFIKTYAPYLPLMFIVGFGLFISLTADVKTPQKHNGDVLAYSINTTDPGLLEATNDARAQEGIEPLEFSEILDQAAQDKANDMSKRDYWSHNTPDGKEPWVFIDKAGYQYFKAAENLAYGFQNSEATVVGWLNSPSHRANLMDPDLKEVGFGIIDIANYQGKGPETLVVAMYGLPTPTVASATAKKSPISINSNNAPVLANTNTAVLNTPEETANITYAQTLTKGYAPWISLAVGISIGLMVMYLLLKHTRNIVRTIKDGEQFILHHPLLDSTIVAALALATILSQTAGNVH